MLTVNAPGTEKSTTFFPFHSFVDRGMANGQVRDVGMTVTDIQTHELHMSAIMATATTKASQFFCFSSMNMNLQLTPFSRSGE